MPRRIDRSFWTNDLPIIGVLLSLALPFYWLFSYSGPYVWLVELEARLTGGRTDPGIITLILIVVLVLCVQGATWVLNRVLPKPPADAAASPSSASASPAPEPAHHASPPEIRHHGHHKDHHHHPATADRSRGPHPLPDAANRYRRLNRPGSAWFGIAVVAMMPMSIFLVMAAVYAIIGATRGPLTRTSAAALEGGAAAGSRWIEVSGVADTRDSIEITHTGRGQRWHEWYVPVIAPGRDAGARATIVFLSIDDHRRRQFSRTAPAFSGTVSVTSLPNQAKAYFAKHGLSVDPHHLLVNFGETPSDVLGDAKMLGLIAGSFAAVSAISFLIARIRSKKAARR